MNNSLSKALLGAAMAGAALLSLSAASWSMNHGEGADHDPSRMVAHMAQRLDLSEEQQNEVEGLMNASQEQSVQDRKRMQELQEEMRAQRDNFDAGKAQTIADEIGQITGRMVFQATSTQAQVYSLLSDEQKAEMVAMMEKRDSRREKWRSEGRKNRE